MEKINLTIYENFSTLLGRVLIGGLFAFAGFGKISGFEGTAGWMASAGLPFASFLLILTIILELGGGIALILGYKTKLIAFLLAGFTLLATLLFHNNLSDMNQMLFFTKNLMIVGGLLAFSSFGSGRISLDKVLNN
ncbi:MAG: DoxX family protein [Nanoarchaeota archaeon]|nr:DoxX family protein [Nanoarchaeota archaeon]